MFEQTRAFFIFTCNSCDFELHLNKSKYSFHEAFETIENNGWKNKSNKQGKSTYYEHYCKNCVEKGIV